MNATVINSLTCSTEYITGKICVTYTPKNNKYYSLINITLEEFDFELIKQIKLGQRATVQNKNYFNFNAEEIKLINSRFVKNNGEGRIRATIRTYSDSSYTKEVGTATQKSIKLSMSELPTVNLTVTPDNGDLPLKFKDIYIQNISRVHFEISPEFSNGATFGGVMYAIKNVVQPSGQYDFRYTSKNLNFSGLVRVLAAVWDSNNNTKSEERYIDFCPYSKPDVVIIDCERCDENHNPKDNGTFLHIKVKRVYNKIIVNDEQLNFCQVRYICRYPDGSPKTGGEILFENLSDIADVYLENVVEDTTTSYLIDIVASDDVTGANKAKSRIIPSDKIDYHFGGNKICFGGYATHDKSFEIANDWDFYLHNQIVNGFVVEDGIYQVTKYCDETDSAVAPDPETGVSWPANKWHYKIWNNGQYLMFGNFAIKVDSNTKVGALYKSNTIAIETPFNIVSAYSTGNSKESNMWVADCGIMRLGVEEPEPFNALFIKTLSPEAIASDTTVYSLRLIVAGFIDE